MTTRVTQTDSLIKSGSQSRLLLSMNIFRWGAVLLILAAGLALRLFDLTDQPLDFHPTRQLRSAIIARGMYYEMLPDADPSLRERAIAFANSTGQYEPSILERVVAITYLAIGREELWIARLYNSLFWIIGGIALFALARRLTDTASPAVSWGAALIALAYYLFLPFGVQASRSFQPDPGMVMWILLTLYALVRWSDSKSWKWALAAGLLGGMAVLVKAVAGYIIGAAAAAIVLHTLGIKRSWKNPQVWSMAILMLVPTLLYYAGRQGRAAEYFSTWTVSLSHLLLDPALYVRWLNLVQSLMSLAVILLGLFGVIIAAGRTKALLAGLWVGYGLYGLMLPYQMYTHNYYHIQLIPILALSILPVAALVLEQVLRQNWFWKILFAAVLLVGITFPSVISVNQFSLEDNRHEPAYWEEIASYLPTDGKIIALTQDYGYRLMYYGWRKVSLWPNRGELNLSQMRGSAKDIESMFAKRTEGVDYFLITAFGQYKDQPALRDILETRYPLIAEGDGYLIYDLAHPLSDG
jgi:hypothetical protein